MRRKVSFGVALLALLAMLVGCYSAPVMPPTGMIYNDTKAPLNIGHKGDFGAKTGMATAQSFFGIVSLGDCSVSAAAANGNISTVKHLDYQFFNVLGFQKFTTIAYGD